VDRINVSEYEPVAGFCEHSSSFPRRTLLHGVGWLVGYRLKCLGIRAVVQN
jgi:hypothetical protein